MHARLDEGKLEARARALIELAVDGARKAEGTRAKERVQRIGRILATASMAPDLDVDEVEEMMRIAMNLTDREVHVLKEFVRIHGPSVAKYGRIERHNASGIWEQGNWGNRLDGELESMCSKLESFGLVSRLAPPNNLNAYADFQSRFALLHKGLRFAHFTKEKN